MIQLFQFATYIYWVILKLRLFFLTLKIFCATIEKAVMFSARGGNIKCLFKMQLLCMGIASSQPFITKWFDYFKTLALLFAPAILGDVFCTYVLC